MPSPLRPYTSHPITSHPITSPLRPYNLTPFNTPPTHPSPMISLELKKKNLFLSCRTLSLLLSWPKSECGVIILINIQYARPITMVTCGSLSSHTYSYIPRYSGGGEFSGGEYSQVFTSHCHDSAAKISCDFAAFSRDDSNSSSLNIPNIQTAK